MNEKIENLLSQMTLEEKVSLLAGAGMWTTVPIPRLGIPAIKVTDGPNGARGGGSFAGGLTSACLPVGIALAATWDTELIERVGQTLGEEAKTKGAHLLLAPTVNIHRSPLNGRNFECYSEDPYLSARIAVAYINGVQSRNVGTTVKHYVCNDSEFERNSISSEVTERALREIYLPPFEAAVKEAKTWSVMSSYNKVNGTYAGDNSYLLTEILRKEWGFEGFVMSDWTGTKSTSEAVKGGLDLEMPGPTVWRGKKLLQAVQDGKVDEAAINNSIRCLLTIIYKSGAFSHPEEAPEQAIDRPEHRSVARQASAEGMVLLKNSPNILPLERGKIKSLAIIGPNAKAARIMGGGSARVNAHYAITPYDGILNKVGNSIKIGYEIGCFNHRFMPLLDPAWITPKVGEGGHGLLMEFYNNADFSGTPVLTRRAETLEQIWFGPISPEITTDSFSATFTGTLSIPESGKYTLGLASAGLSRLYLDGKEVIDNWTHQTPGGFLFGAGTKDATSEKELSSGQSYELKIEYKKVNPIPLAGFRLGCLPPTPEDSIGHAAALAALSDVALVFVGLNDEWESEGEDRPDMELAGNQVELIERVAGANKNTIVVLNTGSPITMNWLDKVTAVVQAWYPGQECGNAIADVLFGDVNPCGKLPQTFPKKLEDNPAYINYPGENGKVYYGEGIFVGYRYYEKKKVEPLFPFGYGLSYTSFSYNNLRLSKNEIHSGEELRVSVDVTNSGSYSGKEIVQLYVKDVQSSLMRPEKELKGFVKVSLEPGKTKTVTLYLNRRSLAYYDDLAQKWVAEAGEFEVLVGSSSTDIRASTRFRLTETARFGDRPEPPGIRLSTKSMLSQLLANEEAKAIFAKYLPGFESAPQIGMAMGFSLEQVAGFAPQVFTDEIMQAIAADLEKISPVSASEMAEPPRISLWQRLIVKLASLLRSRRKS